MQASPFQSIPAPKTTQLQSCPGLPASSCRCRLHDSASPRPRGGCARTDNEPDNTEYPPDNADRPVASPILRLARGDGGDACARHPRRHRGRLRAQRSNREAARADDRLGCVRRLSDSAATEFAPPQPGQGLSGCPATRLVAWGPAGTRALGTGTGGERRQPCHPVIDRRRGDGPIRRRTPLQGHAQNRSSHNRSTFMACTRGRQGVGRGDRPRSMRATPP